MQDPGDARGPRPFREYTVALPAERRLCVAEYGDDRGIPAIYCHGFPACRYEAGLGEQAARRAGVRLIAADRPGYGRSSRQEGRRIIDWARDVARLADDLDLGRFHLIGVSGGAPFALACAASLGDRVIGTAIVCGMAPIAGRGATRGMLALERLWLGLAGRMPGLTSALLTPGAAALLRRFPYRVLALMRAALPVPDRQVLSDPEVAAVVVESVTEAFARDSRGAAQDLILYTRPWAFSLAQVQGPVDLWHGELDRTVPARMGRELADSLPRCRTHFVPGEGHFSLPVRHMERILGGLAAAAPGP